MRKIQPGKRGAYQSAADKRRSYNFKKLWMPQLQYLKSAGDYKYPYGDFID